MKEQLVPELRFPEFEGEWEKKKLKNVVKFIKSYSYSRNDEGEGKYSHIHYGDIHSTYNGMIAKNTIIPKIKSNKEHIELENGDIIIADASEDYKDLGKTVVLLDKDSRNIIAGLHTFALRPNNKLNSIYFLNYSYSDRYKKYMYTMGTGVSVFGINKKNLEDMNILLPTLLEQEKIGDFFYKIDKKLELQQEKIDNLKEYKKGMMQRIFSQEIRFKDDNGKDYPDWEEKKLGEISNIKTGSTNVQDAVDNGKYIFFDRSIVVKRIDIYNYDEEAIIYPGEGSEFHPRYYKGKYALHQRAYSITSNRINMMYLNYMLGMRNKHFLRMAVGSTVKSLRMDNFETCSIFVPIKEEQIKIANLLSSIDKKIGLEEEKLEEYKKFKKGLMQRMFI